MHATCYAGKIVSGARQAGTNFTQPKRERTADSVYAQLRDAILIGQVASGAHLSVPMLASQFGVSRSPVREAVQRLIRDGLAHEQPHKGARVVRLELTELVDLYDVRELLEGLAARLAASRATESQLASLRKLVTEHTALAIAGDERSALEADVKFHTRLRQISGNRPLIEQLARLDGQVRVAMSTTAHAQPGAPSEAAHEHLLILEAITERNPRRAEDLSRGHIHRLRTILAGER